MSHRNFLLLPEDFLFSMILTKVWFTSSSTFYIPTLECNLHEGKPFICYYLHLHMIDSQNISEGMNTKNLEEINIDSLFFS